MATARARSKPKAPALAKRWRSVLAVDADRWAIDTYRRNFPGVPTLQLDVDSFGVLDRLRRQRPDVLLAGPPCQPFSSSGKGMGGDDARDGWPAFLAALRAGRPRMFLAENVEGFLRRRFDRYRRELLSTLEAVGYVVELRELDAWRFGTPQFRNRVWIWGIRRDLAEQVRFDWPAPTHARPDDCQGGMFGGGLEPWVTCGEALSLRCEETGCEPCIFCGYWFEIGPLGRYGCPNCNADGAEGCEEGAPYRWSEAMATKKRPAESGRPAPAVTAKLGKGGAEGLVSLGNGLVGIYDAQNRIERPLDRPAGTLQANAMAKGGRAGHYAIMGGGVNPRHPGGQREERDITDEPATTLAGPSGNGYPEILAEPAMTIAPGNREPFPNADYRNKWTRRLTPRECLRLMSAPNDFRFAEDCPITHQYRIAGNGWACLMARALSARLAAADPASRTVADIFCGGGLGACGWHGRAWERGPA